MRYKSSGHTKYRNMYHLVWVPKYIKRVLDGEIKIRLEHLFHECADVNRWDIEELNIQLDHVHLMIRLSPNDRVSDVVRLLKGGSSRII